MVKIKTVITRALSFISALTIVLSLTVSCAPKPSDVFKSDADAWFKDFNELHKAVKSEDAYEYSKTGSVAVQKPKISAVSADTAVSEYYEKLKNEFRLRSKTEQDKLLISFKAYKASEDITGLEVTSFETLEGVQTKNLKTFNFDESGLIETDELLSRLTLINAKDELMASEQYKSAVDKEKLKKSRDYQLLYTDSGINVLYAKGAVASDDIGEICAAVPYSKLRYALPESIKKNVPEDKSVRTVDITKKLVALTFDDGPNKTYTNDILDTLEAYGCVATFFDVGNVISSAPDVMKRASDMGCEMGSHSWSHKNLKTASVDKIKEEISKTDAKFEEVLGYKPKLLRPPYGAVGSDLKANCSEYLIGWSVDTLDWKYRDKDKVVASVKNEGNLDGDVILMHSLYKSTADAVRELVPWLIENDYQLVTVSELMKYKYDTDMEPGKYYTGNFFKADK